MFGGKEPFEDSEAKEGKNKMDKNTVEIKIRFNKFWLERVVYFIIILVLIVMVIFNPMERYKCEKNPEDITSKVVASKVEEEVPEIEAEEENIEIEPETEIEPESAIEPETENETKLSGEAGLTIGNIGLNNDSKRIEYIWVYIDNDKGLFVPLLRVYWYGASTPEAVKENAKYEYEFPSLIPTGKTNKKVDEEIDRIGGRMLAGRYLNLDPDDKKATIRIELYDASNKNNILDTKTKTISVVS